MKYIARPIEVDAFVIEQVGDPDPALMGGRELKLAETVGPWIATHAMLARIEPKPGDYWVVQPDGYNYLNPKAVFESKYRPKNQ